MEIKYEKGKDTGKTRQLQTLCKQWFMAARNEDGTTRKNVSYIALMENS